jgi:hypothetical protein
MAEIFSVDLGLIRTTSRIFEERQHLDVYFCEHEVLVRQGWWYNQAE